MQVTPPEFAAAIEALLKGSRPSRLAVGVSGGPDSVALALCLQSWGQANQVAIFAFVVDHRLRPESATEAETARRLLVERGFKTEILVWNHPALTSRIEAEARKARYALLFDACRRHGIAHLALAHQKNEQAETILMRLAKGSGPDGLSGMAAVTKREGITLLRPLLSFSKERLIATCEAAKLPYVTDPSNDSAAFARGRLRRAEALLAEEGFTVDRLIDLGERSRETAEALAWATASFYRAEVRREETGLFRCDRQALAGLPDGLAMRLLAACLQNLHQRPYPPERLSLLALLKAIRSPDQTDKNLNGCRVRLMPQIQIQREASMMTDKRPLRPGETVLWDDRWHVTLSAAYTGPALELRALGTPTHEALDRLAPNLRHDVPQGLVRATLPALYAGDTPVLLPVFGASDLASARLNPPPFQGNEG